MDSFSFAEVSYEFSKKDFICLCGFIVFAFCAGHFPVYYGGPVWIPAECDQNSRDSGSPIGK
jgi:hypothetical protein